MLSSPPRRVHLDHRHERRFAARQLLFVCGGNTSRSPMAAAIARTEVAAHPSTRDWRVESAGVTVPSPGAPLTPEATTALLDLGIDTPLDHQSRQLTPALCVDADLVCCMTRAHRDQVIALAPGTADRTVCLDPDADIPDPSGQPIETYRDCAIRLRTLIRVRLTHQHEH